MTWLLKLCFNFACEIASGWNTWNEQTTSFLPWGPTVAQILQIRGERLMVVLRSGLWSSPPVPWWRCWGLWGWCQTQQISDTKRERSTEVSPAAVGPVDWVDEVIGCLVLHQPAPLLPSQPSRVSPLWELSHAPPSSLLCSRLRYSSSSHRFARLAVQSHSVLPTPAHVLPPSPPPNHQNSPANNSHDSAAGQGLWQADLLLQPPPFFFFLMRGK